ncbi:MAG: phospholipase D family protein [Burkholderiaceae bacterium]
MLHRLVGALLIAALAGCAGVLPQVERLPSKALLGAADAPLVTLAHDAGLPEDTSGVWPLPQAAFALDARLAMVKAATRSIDLQSYLIADDATGRMLLRALRDAALRGVRVRVLVDDLYTTDTDRLLLGLAAHPNVEVRLFNPFVTARDSSLRRLVALARGFTRLNHRMHNKLFIADGAVAMVGGRNLADEYFLRGKQGNFIDFDLLVTGAVLPQLNHWFDLYWNSLQVYPALDIVRAAGPPPAPADALRAGFEQYTAADAPEPAPAGTDFFGAPPFSTALSQGHVRWLAAEAFAFADSPLKIEPENYSIPVNDTVTHRFLKLLGDAQSEVLLFSPYFIPGAEALQRIKALRAAGVSVRVVTNSLAASDEPLVSIGLERHQPDLLKMGVDLYEMSSGRLKLDHTLRGLLGASTGRLHAKLGFLDRKTVLVGSMNLDPRSAKINTEIGMMVHSPELAHMILSAFKVDAMTGVYRVQLRADGAGVRWTTLDADTQEELDIDPDTSLLQRLRLMLLSWFIPESQL